MPLQVKLFANGIKAVLKEQKGLKQPAVLRIFDKEGCLIKQREIINNRNFNGFLDKLTVGTDASYGRHYFFIQRKISAKINRRKTEYTEMYSDFKKYGFGVFEKHSRNSAAESVCNRNISLNGDIALADYFIMPEKSKFEFKRDEISDLLEKMHLQWFKPRKKTGNHVERDIPKPMKFKGINC